MNIRRLLIGMAFVSSLGIAHMEYGYTHYYKNPLAGQYVKYHTHYESCNEYSGPYIAPGDEKSHTSQCAAQLVSAKLYTPFTEADGTTSYNESSMRVKSWKSSVLGTATWTLEPVTDDEDYAYKVILDKG